MSYEVSKQNLELTYPFHHLFNGFLHGGSILHTATVTKYSGNQYTVYIVESGPAADVVELRGDVACQITLICVPQNEAGKASFVILFGCPLIQRSWLHSSAS